MIEHVLPRNAKEAYWKDNFSADQRRNWANKFGNLVIITGAKKILELTINHLLKKLNNT